MKKLIFLSLAIILLTGCFPKVSTVNLERLEHIPRKVQNVIQPDVSLQLVEKNKDHYYIVYRSVSEVQMIPGNGGNAIKISIYESPSDSSDMKTYIYKLTKNSSEEYVRVYFDGEQIPFDVVTEL